MCDKLDVRKAPVWTDRSPAGSKCWLCGRDVSGKYSRMFKAYWEDVLFEPKRFCSACVQTVLEQGRVELEREGRVWYVYPESPTPSA